jgi:ribosome-associated translation inhibitor RaiA
MLFLLATPEYNNIQSNTTKVKVHLRNGLAEIFDQHQDLMGKVDNNIVEIETNFENKLEKFLFVLQDAVFIVSNQGLEGSSEQKGTGVYVYAKKAREINSSVSIEEMTKQCDQKKLELDTEIEKVKGKEPNLLDKIINSKILLLQEDLEFLQKSLSIAKEFKK